MPAVPRPYRYGVLRTLLQPRYLALSVLMILVALACSAAGSWQVFRLAQKAHWNSELRHNAHAAPMPIAGFIPLTNSGGHLSSHRIQFHAITATGSYDAAHVDLVREATVNDESGFYVLTPFDTADGVLLVVRGFIAQAVTSAGVPTAPAPPAGTVTITARLQPGETRNDGAAVLTGQQLESINPRQQAVRLGRPVFDAYAELVPGNPGVGSLTPIPFPDLSNPAGGAIEPQHLAYVIQWFLFALLALAAPVVMARAETRHRAVSEFDAASPPAADVGQDHTDAERRRAKLADRYGRTR